MKRKLLMVVSVFLILFCFIGCENKNVQEDQTTTSVEETEVIDTTTEETDSSTKETDVTDLTSEDDIVEYSDNETNITDDHKTPNLMAVFSEVVPDPFETFKNGTLNSAWTTGDNTYSIGIDNCTIEEFKEYMNIIIDSGFDDDVMFNDTLLMSQTKDKVYNLRMSYEEEYSLVGIVFRFNFE